MSGEWWHQIHQIQKKKKKQKKKKEEERAGA